MRVTPLYEGKRFEIVMLETNRDDTLIAFLERFKKMTRTKRIIETSQQFRLKYLQEHGS